MFKFSQFAGGLISYAFMLTPAFTADIDQGIVNSCAVSAFNVKMQAATGYYDDNNGLTKGALFHGAGSMALPLGCRFGLQLDTAIGSLDGKTTGGGAVHAFTRNPSSYLMGGYAEYSVVGNNDIWRLGAEAELYLDRITFSAVGGYENSNRTNGDVFASVNASYYVTDNFNITAGYRHFLDVSAGAVNAEWMLQDTPLSIFAEGQIGTKKHRMIFAGLRYHFGGSNKSLIRRHREDDPFIHITSLIRRVKPKTTNIVRRPF